MCNHCALQKVQPTMLQGASLRSRLQVVESRLPAADREMLVPPKRVSLADIALAGDAKPPLSSPAPSAPSQAAPAPAPSKASPQPQQPSSQTRGLEPLTPPNKDAGPVAASSQLPPVQEASAVEPLLTGNAPGPPGAAVNGHQQTSPSAEAVHLRAAAVAGGSAPDHAPISPDSRERAAVGDGQRADPEQQPAKHSGAANGRPTPQARQGNASDTSDLRQPPAPPSPRKWWFGLAKRTAVA